jgi:hypothetical protein
MVFTGAGGSAIITAGKTAISVIHNLGKTPVSVLLSPGDDLGREYWASSVTTSTLVINISSADVVNHKLYWYVL